MQLTKMFLLSLGRQTKNVLPQGAPSVRVICKMLGSQLMVANCLALEIRGK